MKQYLDLLQHILDNGVDKEDRTGVGTRSVFGYQMRFNLKDGFPAVTTKRLAWKSVVGELLWFMEGSPDERRLAELTYGKPREDLVDKDTIWTANARDGADRLDYMFNDNYRELGPIYGEQWRSFNGEALEQADQLKWLINEIQTNPTSRRLILSAWNPNEVPYMALPPCHVLCQFIVVDGALSCQLYQRSADSFLGSPFNVASYSLLTHLIARECGLDVGEFVYTLGDAHIYLNHMDQVKEQLTRAPHKLPKLVISDGFDLMDGINTYEFPLDSVDAFKLENYECHPTIKAPMAV